MIKKYLTIILLCCANLFTISCNSNIKLDVVEKGYTQEQKHIENDDFAIYPSSINENNTAEINKYIHYNRILNIQFPQIYYANDYSEYNEEIEIEMNNKLFLLSLGNDTSFLIGRDNRDLKEYKMDYMITRTGQELVSIKYFGHLDSVYHAQSFCYGITFYAKTGEIVKVSDYITIDNDIIKRLKTGNIKYYSSAEYDEELIVNQTLEFIKDYNNNFVNINNCFYIEEEKLYLIISVNQGNSNYIILEMPLD